MKDTVALVAVFAALLFGALPAVAEPSLVRYGSYGFSIQPLESPRQVENNLVFFSFVPGDSIFSPNINVIMQVFSGTMAEYRTLSEEQFASLGWSLISTTDQPDGGLVFEYEGQQNGLDLRWYSRVVQRGTTVFLVTASATQAQWPEFEKQLVYSVRSFAVER